MQFSDCEKKRWTYSKEVADQIGVDQTAVSFCGEWEERSRVRHYFQNYDDLWRDGGRASFRSGKGEGGERGWIAKKRRTKAALRTILTGKG